MSQSALRFTQSIWVQGTDSRKKKKNKLNDKSPKSDFINTS